MGRLHPRELLAPLQWKTHMSRGESGSKTNVCLITVMHVTLC